MNCPQYVYIVSLENLYLRENYTLQGILQNLGRPDCKHHIQQSELDIKISENFSHWLDLMSMLAYVCILYNLFNESCKN